jgi:hypothetical protein
LLLGGIFIVLPLGFAKVQLGEALVVQNNFGDRGIVREDFLVGFTWAPPIATKRFYVDRSYFFLNFSNTHDFGEEYGPLDIRTRDNNNVTVDVSIPIRIVPGMAHMIVDEGLHIGDQYKQRAHNTTVGVLNEYLAELSSQEWYEVREDSEQDEAGNNYPLVRLRVADRALTELNQRLSEFYIQADDVHIRSFSFRQDYELQLAQIQLLEQQEELDGAQQRLANRQQVLDNYIQETEALKNGRAAWWEQRTAVLDDGYLNGITAENREAFIDVLVEVHLVNEQDDARADPSNSEHQDFAATVRPQYTTQYTSGHYGFGIEGINAETAREVSAIQGRTFALRARYQAEADQVTEEIIQHGQAQVNRLLASPGGRSLVGLEAASNVSFGDAVIHSDDNRPLVLDLDRQMQLLTGRN